MAFDVRGVFFESCSCDAICPCTWSNGAQSATHDYCRASLAFRIDEGTIDGVEVGGRVAVLVIDTPPNMLEGNWRAGLVIDDGASDDQAESLGRMMGGELGGPPEAMAPLIGEFLGIARLPIDVAETDDGYQVSVGEDTSYQGRRMKNFDGGTVQLTGIGLHPAGPTIDVAVVDESSVSLHGIDFGGTTLSGFTGPFAWSS